MLQYDVSSKVESRFIEKSGFQPIYKPTEKMQVVVVDNFPLLGKLTALRFLEWCAKNPGGVISLPTGKTPEFFIRFTEHYLSKWNDKETQQEMEELGLQGLKRPDMSSLHFVQIDEFYPILPEQQNSFHHYIRMFYLKGFGLDPQKAMLIDTSKIGVPNGYEIAEIFPGFKVDLSLRTRHARSRLEQLQKDTIFGVDEFCMAYEENIRSLGGLGFFLGGIGPDGHIGFNVSGSDFHSTTRLTAINYETAAASAGDLGGIETSRDRPVITIGLETITGRKDATAIIMSAGEAKARIVASSVESDPTIEFPATSLHRLSAARFYMTTGSSMGMKERNYVRLQNKEKIEAKDTIRYIIDLSLKERKPLSSLTSTDLMNDRFASLAIKKSGIEVAEAVPFVRNFLLKGIENGMRKVTGQTILHTSPHHDDEILGYMPYLMHQIREDNRHFFSYMTSGFTSVTNDYLVKLLSNLGAFMERREFYFLTGSGYFDRKNEASQNDDIYHFLDGVAADSEEIKADAISRRLYRILSHVHNEEDPSAIKRIIAEHISYCESRYPGQKDVEPIQRIKGKIREWEAELVWGYFGYETSSVIHARLGFYTGDIFTQQPTMEADVKPILEILRKVNPSIVSVAYDPEGSGPDTHYKVLQAIAEAMRIYEKESGNSSIKIWGYRNVWHRFHPSDTNVTIPVSLNSIGALNNIFLNCFGSQKNASFPSFEYDGPFSKLAQKVFVEQYAMMKTCLGEEYFFRNSHPRLRGARGVVHLKEMGLQEFYAYSRELKAATERKS